MNHFRQWDLYETDGRRYVLVSVPAEGVIQLSRRLDHVIWGWLVRCARALVGR